MNLPNKLTIARLGLTVLFVIATYSGLPWSFTAATLLFGVAAFTDYLDGRIARQRGLVTSFGKLMDPLADKVLMAAAFIVLLDLYRDGATMPAWFVIMVLAREFLVTGLRLVASSQGTVLAADWLGKQKTIWQIVLASYLLVMNAAVHEPAMAWVRPLFDSPAVGRRIMVPVLLTITLVVTVWSGAAYMWKNRRLVLDQR
jgi:CDP-diacylglycerol--glycerol-3-phosphate 3-phosphatidyltransferase